MPSAVTEFKAKTKSRRYLGYISVNWFRQFKLG